MKTDVVKIQEVVTEILRRKGIRVIDDLTVPVGVSNRHVHLSEEDLEKCFGQGYVLTPIKELSQPGQFACMETVNVCGPKGSIDKVRILGPVRKRSQVELFAADNFKLGTKAPLRLSGDLDGAAPVTIVGPVGSAYLPEAAIVAKRHVHMLPEDAQRYGVVDGQEVSIQTLGERGATLGNVIVRVTEQSRLDCHIDTEEANAVGLKNGDRARLVK